MIKLGIVGYGKMGKEIESILNKKDFDLVEKYDVINPVKSHLKDSLDVAIEFTTPQTVIDNIEFLASKKINIVCGTTGWYDKIDEVKNIVEKNGIGFVYASNFSVGVNLFFQIVKKSSVLMNKFSQYDVIIEETHHIQKLDKPSGTAIRTAEYVNETYKKEIEINSKRIENVVGNHKVIFNSSADTITLEHNAKSRRGFAEGALLAAKFIHNRKGFYKFEDIFNELN